LGEGLNVFTHGFLPTFMDVSLFLGVGQRKVFVSRAHKEQVRPICCSEEHKGGGWCMRRERGKGSPGHGKGCSKRQGPIKFQSPAGTTPVFHGP
jgi:hypothetical protein